ncbi:MAG: hypothetical protein ACT4OV_04500 [Microthrixaceae bacterium]
MALIAAGAMVVAAENEDGGASASVVRLLLVPLVAGVLGAVAGAVGSRLIESR